jgi:RHS repeat-associated protein
MHERIMRPVQQLPQRRAFLFLAFAITTTFLAITPAWAQQGWFDGYTQAYYATPTAACMADVAQANATAQGQGNPWVSTFAYVYPGPTISGAAEYNCFMNVANDPHTTWSSQGYSIACASGFAQDVYSPTGCSPRGGVQSGKDEGKTGCCVSNVGNASAGEPININSGNMYYEFTDYATAGQNPLKFTRHYNSRSNLTGVLGSNWSSTYDRYIYLWEPSQVLVQRSDGAGFIFNLSGGVWSPDTDVDYTLTNSGSTWTLTGPDDTVETYTANSAGTTALLNTIKARNGYTQTLSYNGSNQLTEVTDSYNRSLTLTYSGTLLSTVGTPDSTTLTFAYNSITAGVQLLSVTYSTSPSTSLTYVYGDSSLPLMLTSITDENGNTYATWTYDAYGRGLTSALGGSSLNANLTTVAYNDTAVTRTVTNAFGVTDTYTFSSLQNVPKVTQISRSATSTTAAATEAFSYDTNGYLASKTDWNGNESTYVNNIHGLPTTMNEAVGSSVARTTTIVYDSTFVHLPDSITTPGLTTAFTYDGSGNVLTRKLTDTTTTTTPYSTNGQTRTWTNTWSNFLLASVKSPNGNTTSFGYNATGVLTSVTDALSHVTNVTAHTAGGLPETIVDPNSVTTALTYDPRQRLLSSSVSTSAGARTTTYTYDAAGNLTKTTLPDSSYVANTFDTAHRITKITDALGNYTNYTLDALGDILQQNVYDNNGGLYLTHSDSYDALGRLLVDTGGRSQTVTYAYDANGNATTIKDGFSHSTTRVFDALNRLTTSTDPNSGVTTTAYDAHDRITIVTDANSHATTYVFDGFGDSIQQASPDTGTTVYHYDADANLVQKIDGAGVVMNAQYDALDRIENRQYPADNTQGNWFAYDQTSWPHGFGIGRLTSISDAVGCCYNLGYDERGNVTALQRSTGSGNSTTYLSYDAASRPQAATYPSGLYVAWNRDAMGRIYNVAINYASMPGQYVAWIGNPPFGPMNWITYGNNINGPYQRDRDYNLYNINLTGAAGTLQNLSYTFDNNNNVTAIADSVNAANSQTLGYDVISRLTSATSGTGGYGSLAWTYDKVGNRLSQTAGTATTTYAYTSGTNRLASITAGGTATVTTNANGNITSIPPADSGTAATFTYNVANHLSSVTGSPLAANFVYDSMGQRFSKQNPGSNPITYTFDLKGTLLEENDNGAITDYIYVNGRPIGLFVPTSSTLGTLYYVHPDRIGMPQFVTDANQNVKWSTTNQPYGTTGTTIGSITQNIRFPGQYSDVETGFYYNVNRDYMPNLGRYLEADPIGLAGGLNPYLYANGNPGQFADRRGLDAEGSSDSYDQDIQNLNDAYGPSWILPSSNTPINNPHPAPNQLYLNDNGVGAAVIGDALDMGAAAMALTGDIPIAEGLHNIAMACNAVSTAQKQDPGPAATDLIQDLLYKKLHLDELQKLVTLPVKAYWQQYH